MNRTILSWNRFLKAALSVSLIGISVGILTTSHAAQYEESIYSGLSPLLWPGVLILPIIAGVAMMYHLRTNQAVTRLLLALLSVYIIVLFLFPIVRGYHLYGRGGADVLFHLGQVRTILETGYSDPTNWYPITHYLMAVFSLLGVPLRLVPYFTTTVFTILGAIFFITFLRDHDRRASAIGVFIMFALPYATFHRTLHPAVLWFLLFPIGIYLVDRTIKHKKDYRLPVLLCGFGFFIAITHPTVAALLVTILTVSIGAALFVFRGTSVPKWKILTPTLLTGFISYIWFSQFERFQFFIGLGISQLFFGEDESSVGDGVASTSSQYNLAGLAVRTIELYATQVLLWCLGLAMVCVILYRLYRGRRSNLLEINLVGQFTVAVGFAAVFLVVSLIGADIIRITRYLIFVSIILVAFLLSQLSRDKIPRVKGSAATLLVGIAVVLIVASSVIAAAGLYHENYHQTEREYQGTNWYFDNGDQVNETRSFAMSYKMSYYLAGSDSIDRSQGPFRRLWAQDTEIPDGLGTSGSVGSSYPESTYVITKVSDLPMSENMGSGYTESDKRRFSESEDVSKIYSSSGFEIWLVNYDE